MVRRWFAVLVTVVYGTLGITVDINKTGATLDALE
jgi:hypothetical protein